MTNAFALALYIIKYITKSEREIGLMLTNAQNEASKHGNSSARDALKNLGSVYLHNCDVCAQEAVYRVTNMHLGECSRSVVFVPTGKNIVRMSLPLSTLKDKASSHGLEEEAMWMKSIVDKYKNRPDGADFDDTCIVTFSSEYRVLSKNENSATRISLKQDMGFVVCRTRTAFAVVRYMLVSLDEEDEEEVGR